MNGATTRDWAEQMRRRGTDAFPGQRERRLLSTAVDIIIH